jgi:pilus assembly protein Flp/PilA
MIDLKKTHKRSQSGATAIEYALIAALMTLALIPALQALSGNTNGLYSTVSNKIVTAMQNAR